MRKSMKLYWIGCIYAVLATCRANKIWVKNTDDENVLCEVPTNYKNVIAIKSKCFIYFDDSRNFEDATAYCKSFGEMAQVSNGIEFRAISQLKLTNDAWVNFKYNINERTWVYGISQNKVPQNVLKYKNDGASGANLCGKVLHAIKKWDGSTCGIQRHYICQSRGEMLEEACTAIPSEDLTLTLKNYCYYSLETTNYWTALSICTKMNGTLAMPKTQQQWKAASNYMQGKWYSIETQKVWIGIIFKPHGSTWLWSDGNKVEQSTLPFPYTQTAFQAPNANFGKCTVVTRQGTKLIINTEHCGNTQALTLCQVEKDEPLETTTAAVITSTTQPITVNEVIETSALTTEFLIDTTTATVEGNSTNLNSTISISDSSVGIIVGCVVAGIVLIVAILLLLIFCIKRRRFNKQKKIERVQEQNGTENEAFNGIINGYPVQMQWNNNKRLPSFQNGTKTEPVRQALKHSCSMPARQQNMSQNSLSVGSGPVANSTLSNQIDNAQEMKEQNKHMSNGGTKIKLRKRVTAPILRLSGFAMVNNKKNADENGVKHLNVPLQFKRPEYMAESDFSSFTSWDDSDQESVVHSTELPRKHESQNGQKKRSSFHLAYVNVNESETIGSEYSEKERLNKSHSYVNVDTDNHRLKNNHPDVVPQNEVNTDNLQTSLHRKQSDALPNISEDSFDSSYNDIDNNQSMISNHIYETIDPEDVQSMSSQPSNGKTKSSKNIKKIISKVPSMNKKANKTIKQSGEIGPDIILSVPPIRRSRNSASTWEMVATPALVMIEKKKSEERELEAIAEDMTHQAV